MQPDLVSALRSAFPHFQNDEPVTPEAVKAIGKEYADMVMTWEPQRCAIEFFDHDGGQHWLVYESGDADAGVKGGWCLRDDSNLVACSSDPSPAPVGDVREAHIVVLSGLVGACEDERNAVGPDKTRCEHLLDMIEIVRNTPQMPIDKIARWTGFIQGVLAARCVISVDGERDRTRPIFTALTAGEKAGAVATSGARVTTVRALVDDPNSGSGKSIRDVEVTPAREDAVRVALDLAVDIIMANEPGDSRAVSDVAIALAAVSPGDVSDNVMKVINDTRAAIYEARSLGGSHE